MMAFGRNHTDHFIASNYVLYDFGGSLKDSNVLRITEWNLHSIVGYVKCGLGSCVQENIERNTFKGQIFKKVTIILKKSNS